MSAANYLEVVQNEEGEVILRRTEAGEGNTEPLVSLRFSPEVRAMLGAHLGEVALAMLGAGMQATQRLVAQVPAEDDKPRLLH